MLKPVVSKAAADESTGGVAPGYVEDAFEARTKLVRLFQQPLVEGEGNRSKREDKHRQRNPSNQNPATAQRYMRIAHGRMSEAPESCHEGPEEPAMPAHEPQHDQQRHHGKGQRALT